MSLFIGLKGDWSLERRITPHGSFSGIASFTKIDDGTLQYIERGELTLESGDVLCDVTKRYLYKFEGDDALAVYFDDGVDKGKLFHRLRFDAQGVATATYDCPPDRYDSKMTLNFPEGFMIEHVVTGAKKSYTIQSTYTKKRAS